MAVMEHSALPHSLSLLLGKKATLADQVNKPNFISSTTTSIATIIQITELFDSPDASQKEQFPRHHAGMNQGTSRLPQITFVLALLRPLSARMLLRKAHCPHPYPQKFKNTSEFPVPLCTSQEESCKPGVMGLREPWENTEPGCSGEQLTQCLLGRQKMFL